MDNKSVPKRRNINSAKINPAVVPEKIRKTELPLEKLTKQKLIDKFKELEESYLKLVANKEKIYM